MKEKLNKW